MVLYDFSRSARITYSEPLGSGAQESPIQAIACLSFLVGVAGPSL
ncbi:hypothetical protein PP182_19905 [Maribacter sp. PR1]|uniref:Uncharacterized protein n=1 Tax=Maribacter cobaltidurans TaxID=1178778 RepID=A0ABU7IZK5_9FLAO|nr:MULTISPECIES: hypothetical protein [Maribacter]MDC6390961.1 hypothetical protein [Maribacter sp. PR1]MEE1978353.1 hypothetical protein [Maribacter cobaltidurans]